LIETDTYRSISFALARPANHHHGTIATSLSDAPVGMNGHRRALIAPLQPSNHHPEKPEEKEHR
jgi:hypothetical protein